MPVPHVSAALLTACLATAWLPASPAPPVTADNPNVWLNYVGDHPFQDGPWGLHLELQNRVSEWGDDWQQILFRPGANCQVSPALRFSAGYAYVHTFPNGEHPILTDFPEHRAWEQILHRFKFLSLDWQQRLRLEQRWIGEMAPDGSDSGFGLADWRTENRLRYFLRTDLPLSRDRRTYLALWDEIFLNFGGHVEGNRFDQNRAFVGLGRKLSDTTRLEVGYMEQTVRRRGGFTEENNHTLTVWLLSAGPLR
jgi:hypothetical protein